MKKILFQFDTDAHASSFDAVTAIDSGVDHLLQHAHCNCTNVTPLVQGGIFTRGPKDLKNTAIFVGGSDVEAAETIFQKVQESFFGPLRVSVMLDANGCNTSLGGSHIHSPTCGTFCRKSAWSWGGQARLAAAWRNCWPGKGRRSRGSFPQLEQGAEGLQPDPGNFGPPRTRRITRH
ncbi:MAG: methylene-tetrahydromethanopterin dehydrogenase N-terminal domain-containing protein [Planctomycetaceae bacterium]